MPENKEDNQEPSMQKNGSLTLMIRTGSPPMRNRMKSFEEDATFVDELMVSFRTTIEKQREQIKFKDEQIEQSASVHEHEMASMKAELTKEISRLQNKREVQSIFHLIFFF